MTAVSHSLISVAKSSADNNSANATLLFRPVAALLAAQAIRRHTAVAAAAATGNITAAACVETALYLGGSYAPSSGQQQYCLECGGGPWQPGISGTRLRLVRSSRTKNKYTRSTSRTCSSLASSCDSSKSNATLPVEAATIGIRKKNRRSQRRRCSRAMAAAHSTARRRGVGVSKNEAEIECGYCGALVCHVPGIRIPQQPFGKNNHPIGKQQPGSQATKKKQNTKHDFAAATSKKPTLFAPQQQLSFHRNRVNQQAAATVPARATVAATAKDNTGRPSQPHQEQQSASIDNGNNNTQEEDDDFLPLSAGTKAPLPLTNSNNKKEKTKKKKKSSTPNALLSFLSSLNDP